VLVGRKIESGRLADDIGLPPLNPTADRAMICGGPATLADLRVVLDARGFEISKGVGQAGQCVIERAFVEK
jgi:ferredoxin--NADP+ reductase